MSYLVLILSYILGSIPFAYIIVKYIKGIDIRKVGSKNPGAANVFREVSPFWGIVTFILDFSKGFLPPFIALTLGLPAVFVILSGIFSVIGHNWSLFLNFKGGGGLSTSLGAAFAIVPLETLIVGVIFIFLFLFEKLRNRSVIKGLTPLVAAGTASYFLAFIVLFLFKSNVYAYLFLFLLIVIQGIRHFKNIVKWLREKKI